MKVKTLLVFKNAVKNENGYFVETLANADVHQTVEEIAQSIQRYGYVIVNNKYVVFIHMIVSCTRVDNSAV